VNTSGGKTADGHAAGAGENIKTACPSAMPFSGVPGGHTFSFSGLSPLDPAGFQAVRADMHSLISAVYLASYSLDIGAPHRIGFSMRMAYIVAELNTLATNITLSHLNTSSTSLCFIFCSQH